MVGLRRIVTHSDVYGSWRLYPSGIRTLLQTLQAYFLKLEAVWKIGYSGKKQREKGGVVEGGE
jgi:hypothetical protein